MSFLIRISKIVTGGKTDPSHHETEMIVMATKEALKKKKKKKINWPHHELLTVSLHNILSYKYVCLAELTQIIGQLKDIIVIY